MPSTLIDSESTRKTIRLTVNARPVTARVEPRLQLAEFLREHLALTGTHLGCEHGVCGACTVEIDGAPARSCIAYAVACNGAAVRTIEGYDDDPVMADLREAFSAEHALQCGYCTPGMLVTARDIVLRLPAADEARIRKELAGNLCRCTGYVGIVRAIQSVLAKRRGVAPSFPSSPTLLPAGEGGGVPPFPPGESEARGTQPTAGEGRVMSGAGDEGTPATQSAAQSRSPAPDKVKPQTTLRQSFSVDHPRARVWDFFGRLGEVTQCLPGTSVLGAPTDKHVDIKLRIKVGPIAPEFEGGADVERDPANYAGTIRGSARDARSSSTTRGEIRYVLVDAKDGAATRVDLEVGFTLTGPLAQFSRSGIVQDIAQRMTLAFAQNLEARLRERAGGPPADRASRTPAAELDAGSLLLSALWDRIKTFLRGRWGR
jgi:carbon-monoxide dehydrogenase small subunit